VEALQSGHRKRQKWDGYPDKALALETIEKIPGFDAPLLDPADRDEQDGSAHEVKDNANDDGDDGDRD
jgi:hypothetical protein